MIFAPQFLFFFFFWIFSVNIWHPTNNIYNWNKNRKLSIPDSVEIVIEKIFKKNSKMAPAKSKSMRKFSSIVSMTEGIWILEGAACVPMAIVSPKASSYKSANLRGACRNCFALGCSLQVNKIAHSYYYTQIYFLQINIPNSIQNSNNTIFKVNTGSWKIKKYFPNPPQIFQGFDFISQFIITDL